MNKSVNRLSRKLLITAGIATTFNMVALDQANAQINRTINPGLVGEIFTDRSFDLSLGGSTLGDLEAGLNVFYNENKFLRHGPDLSKIKLDINLSSLDLTPDPNFGASVFYIDENGDPIGEAGTVTKNFLGGNLAELFVDFNTTPQDHSGIQFDFDFRMSDADNEIENVELFYEGQTSSWISLNDTLPQAPDLQEGDQYQLMFVTKDVISAVERSDDTETYNNFAQAQAELNPDQTLTDRGVTYQAFASFSTDFDTDGVTPLVTGATANIPITAPVFLVDGTFIGNANQLCNGDTSNSNFINKDQFGNQRGGTPWTGTNRSCGIAGNNNFLGAFRDNQEVPTTSFIGSTGQLLGEWVGLSETLVFDPGDGDGGGPQGEIFRPIFALSTPITVGDDGNGNNNPAPPFNPGNGLGPIAPAITVPEPSALIGLFALGIMGAVSRGKKSKK